MIHPQLSLRYFIEQLDSEKPPRHRKTDMPAWLRTFVWNATDHFDPIGGTARAGYVASQEEDGWVVRLFLGETEIVGGARDGAVVPTAFSIDLDSIRHGFEQIDRFEWHGLPAGSLPEQTRDDATLVIEGLVAGHALRLLINLRAPADMGPGMKQQADGISRPVS